MIDYRSALESSWDPKLAAFQSRLTPGKAEIHGVRVPEIRRLAKLIANDDWRSYLGDVPENFEEEMLRGIVIATAPMDTDERIRLSMDFLRYVDNWATCDSFCSSWKFRPEDSDVVWDAFSSLMGSDSEYPMRVSVIMRMDHYRDRHHAGLLLEDLMSHDNPGYYYRMGAAWAASVLYVDHGDLVVAALESGRFCDQTQNLTIRKIRESRRIPDDEKAELLRLRRRAP
ncbi:MAG: DNA alkylation repair protein [Candidatus Methanomethylophilaceae archaeon]|nr:DNA alkylation repair protein [Candidatus Methanomethylophilaceae archaeon]